jgi:uncharacterized protein (TIGR02145 family)
MIHLMKILSIFTALCFIWGFLTSDSGHSCAASLVAAHITSPEEDVKGNNVSVNKSGTVEQIAKKKKPKKFPWVMVGLGVVAVVASVVILQNKKKSSTDGNDIQYGTVTDIDGNVYRTVRIGNQEWMTEDLRTTRYRNGDPLPNITDNTEWENATTGAYCNYDNNPNNVPTYGRLYNWYAVNDSRNIAPAGWHVPSNAEWITLVNYVGGSEVAGGKLKEAGTTHWLSPNTGATNKFGFTALPCGYRTSGNLNFLALGVADIMWTSSSINNDSAMTWHMDYNYAWIMGTETNKKEGASIRCVKD